ncbi:CKLF-like MARVEL transmembrane domain-containing protein 3 [Sander lucioperca]|uniref:CKLF-like MARVEL transmembrane domain-containing protein 3 n=1 Tax=Sander lucioperca TaxID=283035 RepID=UPI00125D8BB0|nr:CKLF-like MARVEL transmembrane domain-containing protein 3 [Sander lucioperca]
MGDIEAPNSNRPHQNVLLSVLPSKEFASSRKGMLLIAEVALSFISFVCFAASTAAAFVTVPLLEFLAALFLMFAYSTKFNERFKGFLWPLMDFLRCVTASIIFFIISIIAVSKYVDGSSKAAGIFGFIATIVFALDFYLIFNELATFLKQGGGESNEEPSRQQDEFSDSDSD